MIKRVASCLSALIVSFLSLPVVAATVSLDPESLTVSANGTFEVDVYVDAADETNEDPAFIMGRFFVDFDPDQVTYVGFEMVDPAEFRPPDPPLTETASTVDVKFRNADKVGIIGAFTFRAGSDIGSFIEIGLNNSALAGLWFTETPSNTSFTPTMIDAPAIQIVPVPAAAWLMLSGLGLLGFRARRL